MNLFNKLGFEQRAYAIQRLTTLLEMLKEAHLHEELTERGLLIELGSANTQDIGQEILEFTMNYFGTPYSHEASEQ